jgi:putative ABC transport system permease protein
VSDDNRKARFYRLTREATRDRRSIPMLEALVKDMRFAFRGLRKQPAFTFAAVTALALGIGAATTIFSVIQNVLLDPYPMYANVDRIVGVRIRDLDSPRPGGRDSYPAAEFLEYQRQAQSFEEVIGGTGEDVVYTSDAGSEQFVGGLTSGNTFSFMGVPAAIGRTLRPDDALPGAPPVFVLSYRLWATRFGLDANLIGRTFVLNGVPTTLIGVMPARVSKLGADVWKPVRVDPADPIVGDRWFRFQARLKPGVTIAQAQAELEVIGQRIARDYPKNYPKRFSVQVLGIIDSVVGSFRTTLYTMAAAVGLLLLIACANVASMLLSRASSREKEMAIRAALGAGRGALVRQLLVESLLLALSGAVAGCILSYVGIQLLVAAIPEGLIPREAVIRLNVPVMLFSLGVAGVTAIIFGLAPALQTAGRELVHPLRDSGKGTSGGYRRGRLSRALVVGEVALSLVLLTAAGLLMRSFVALQTVALGFDVGNILYIQTSLGASQHKTAAAEERFFSQVMTRVRALPGVLGATTTTGLPLYGGWVNAIEIPGETLDEQSRAIFQLCSDDYLKTLGIRLLQGRDLTPHDLADARRVAVVNRTFVDRYLNGRDAIGRRIKVRTPGLQAGPDDSGFEIIGVFADVKNRGIQEAPFPEAVVPASSAKTVTRALVVRMTGPPMAMAESVKREIWAVDRGVSIGSSRTLTDYLKQFTYAEPRLGLYIFGAFAGVGLALVILGVYSVIAYNVSRQTQEIGIRMALGAVRWDVLSMTLRTGFRLVALGVAIGVLTSLAATRALASQLWNVAPGDPLTLTLVAAIVTAAGLAASYIPALRATRVDPMVVLRSE